MSNRIRSASPYLLAALLTLAVSACGDSDNGGRKPTPTPTITSPTPTPTTPCPLPSPFCGGDFPLNTLETTPYGPAWADVRTAPGQFLPCFGPYALCYYANCTVSADGTTSECPCFELYGVSYVLMTAILNLDSYEATVSQCTADPASCLVPNGAPVCAEINNATFFPSAHAISTFSLYNATVEPIGVTDCTDQPGLYAGCMTAPCFGTPTRNGDGSASINCDCPLYDGPFQIGKDGLSCQDEPLAWSASYDPDPIPTDPCARFGDGSCVPDGPAPCGCPLYTTGTTLPPGSGIDCNEVCQEYASCQRNGQIELGFTCDATLCTSQQHDLLFDACQGLEKCDLSDIFAAEKAAGCSCCASQLCGCAPNTATNTRIFELDAAQRAAGETPQCDINGTLCGALP